MAKLPHVIPVSDFRLNAAAALEKVRGSRNPIVITQRGRAAAVLMSIEEYERAGRERQILRMLARGDREVAKGKGHALDDVFADVSHVIERVAKKRLAAPPSR